MPYWPLVDSRTGTTSDTVIHRPYLGLGATHTPPTALTVTINNIHIVAPYTKGLIKSIKNICGKVGIQVYQSGDNAIKSLLMASKDMDTITQKSGVQI